MRWVGLLLCLWLVSCSPSDNNGDIRKGSWQEVKSRTQINGRFAIYRLRIPHDWIRQDPLPTDNLADTTKALCYFIISSSHGTIRISIHNFPVEATFSRPSPKDQITRWNTQLINPVRSQCYEKEECYNGYCGLYFHGIGKENSILGWALQLSPEHHRTLSQPAIGQEEDYKERRADITIKATGPTNLIDSYENIITQVAHSFEQIQDIPLQ